MFVRKLPKTTPIMLNPIVITFTFTLALGVKHMPVIACNFNSNGYFAGFEHKKVLDMIKYTKRI